MNRRADAGPGDPWVAAPVIRVERPAAGAVVQVTTAGAEPEVAERAAAALADLLRRWDLTDEQSTLARLLRTHESLHVDDDTLLLLALTTEGTLDLPAGVARLSPGQPPPPLAAIRALALDMSCQDLQDETISGFCVAIDHDIAVGGTSPSGHGWAAVIAAGDGSGTDVVTVSTGACITVNPDGADVTAVSAHGRDAWRAASLALSVAELTAADALRQVTDAGVAARVCTRRGAVDIGDWIAREPTTAAGCERTSTWSSDVEQGR
jgi:hypothetical protein